MEWERKKERKSVCILYEWLTVCALDWRKEEKERIALCSCHWMLLRKSTCVFVCVYVSISLWTKESCAWKAIYSPWRRSHHFHIRERGRGGRGRNGLCTKPLFHSVQAEYFLHVSLVLCVCVCACVSRRNNIRRCESVHIRYVCRYVTTKSKSINRYM